MSIQLLKMFRWTGEGVKAHESKIHETLLSVFWLLTNEICLFHQSRNIGALVRAPEWRDGTGIGGIAVVCTADFFHTEWSLPEQADDYAEIFIIKPMRLQYNAKNV